MTPSVKKRTTPLAAPQREAEPEHVQHLLAEIEPTDLAPADIAPPPAVAQAAEVAARDDRFEEGIRTLRLGSTTLRLEERILMVLGGVLAPLGLIVVLLGWWGAAHTPHVFEQLPYLISGGLLGVGLIFLGAFFYFTHWITQLVKEQRAQSAALLDAIGRLQEQVGGQGAGTATGAVHQNGTRPAEPALVATAQGTMAHRTDCVVVAGKPALRRVEAADGLAACKLCEPY